MHMKRIVEETIDWCAANTVKIVKEAADLKRLFFGQVNSKKLNPRIIRRLIKKCKHWTLLNEEYGYQNKRTAERFKKLIKYIVKVDKRYAWEDDDP